ncbi:2-dehydropantoate 2-reductase [Actinocatenispora thailandica]|uniref:2-dehydropantoate 2-reductase n=1 Tax=Actinocatenispora thailandica TaxID=227318 RepID=A0A7R7HV05_9ACTN|nr:oxidoreductase [Actinocatenispora thailandica]BCJ32708.1 2-dehydropantoate 2-reductase [Actinocatenispora thailandica]
MDPSIAVVGPGAIGTTVAAALHEVGRTPRICGRTARERLELHGEAVRIAVPGPVRIDPARAGGAVDLVFLAVKSTQVEAAAPWLAALCGADTVVCVLQNGVEQESTVSPYTSGARVLPAVVWFPAEAQPDGSVRLRGEPRLTLPDGTASHVVLDALRGTRCSTDVAADFTSVAWRKLLQNAVAGLMVLTGRRSGMFARTDIAELSLAYLRECLAVARAEGAVLGDEVPHEIVDGFRSYPADMGTSILADRVADRPLEWNTRNGVVPRRGRAHGIPTPISDLLVPLLAAASDGPG